MSTTATVGNFDKIGLAAGKSTMRILDVMPKDCVPFSQFKKEYFRQLKKRYEKIQVDHS